MELALATRPWGDRIELEHLPIHRGQQFGTSCFTSGNIAGNSRKCHLAKNGPGYQKGRVINKDNRLNYEKRRRKYDISEHGIEAKNIMLVNFIIVLPLRL